VAERLADLELSPCLAGELAPLVAVLGPLNAEIAAADGRITALAAADPIVPLLATAPAVGPITASALVATVDDVTRFRSAHEFEAYLGVVPGERSSGEKRRVGRITKAGNARVRWLLVEAAWRIARSRSEETAALRAWAAGVATRRGKRVAMVALARRLAGVLYAMWRDGAAFDGRKVRAPRARAASVA
jgi:transposase